ncbi:unnamed protein product [Ascophyllum nodosum]
MIDPYLVATTLISELWQGGANIHWPEYALVGRVFFEVRTD